MTDLTDFRVRFATLGEGSDAVRVGTGDVLAANPQNANPAMYGSLAGAAGNMTEPKAGQAARRLCTATGNAGTMLADDLKHAQEAYERSEEAAVKACEVFAKMVEG